MEDYVARNWTQCKYPPKGAQRGCHNTYHFDDVAIGRDGFDRNYMGTNDHLPVGGRRTAGRGCSGRKPSTLAHAPERCA
jgi:hypothetical protein